VLSRADQEAIVRVTSEAWAGHVAKEVFLGMFRGKERGHRIADYVEEQTVECLERHFDVAHEVTGGERRARGMGDAWVRSNGIYNPINVKAGVHGVGGQPNMVSLAKLTAGLLEHWIDSYYLLLVKFTDEESPRAEVQLVDILHFLDFLHFDSGTGQLMLRADRFARHIAGGGTGDQLTLEQIVERLAAMRRDGDERLIATRAKKLAELERRVEGFDPTRPLDQRSMSFG
jgi:hypothetical protein